MSLYGIQSIQDIDEALFQALYPVLGWKGTKLAGRAATAALKFLRIDPGQLGVNDILDKFAVGTYVFDDLERCGLDVNVVLGYINQFVEHEGRKVIIVTNEQEIDAVQFKTRREKLIGKTMEVQSEFVQALDTFTSNIDDLDTKTLFQTKIAEISLIYNQSALSNLRILQQTMWDFERFFRSLSKIHKSHDIAATELLCLFFVLSFELKSGRITENDLRNRQDRLIETMVPRLEKTDFRALSHSLRRLSGIQNLD